MIYTEDSQLRLENVNALTIFCFVSSFPPRWKRQQKQQQTGPTLVVWFSEKHLDLLTTSTAIITSRVFMATAERKKKKEEATLCFVFVFVEGKEARQFVQIFKRNHVVILTFYSPFFFVFFPLSISYCRLIFHAPGVGVYAGRARIKSCLNFPFNFFIFLCF
jgi:hypothetical protein